MREFFEDDKGNKSSLRLLFFITWIAIVGVWVSISMHNWKIASLSTGDAMGVFVIHAAKVAQKYVENNKKEEEDDSSE